jgi:hypothetical protein
MPDQSTTETKSPAKTRPRISARFPLVRRLYAALTAILIDKVRRLWHPALIQTEVMEQTSTTTFTSPPQPGNDNKVWEQLSVTEALRQISYHYRCYRNLLADPLADPDRRAEYVASARQGITLIQQFWTLLGQERTTPSH